MCSHNYVELGNGSKKDINLNGLYLLYTDCSKRLESDIGYVWQYLPLTGVIKAGSTFVIRGKQTNTIKGSMIKVDSSSTKYDFNNQIENLTIDKMTLSTSTEEDLAIYSPDNQNFYTLKLQ